MSKVCCIQRLSHRSLAGLQLIREQGACSGTKPLRLELSRIFGCCTAEHLQPVLGLVDCSGKSEANMDSYGWYVTAVSLASLQLRGVEVRIFASIGSASLLCPEWFMEVKPSSKNLCNMPVPCFASEACTCGWMSTHGDNIHIRNPHLEAFIWVQETRPSFECCRGEHIAVEQLFVLLGGTRTGHGLEELAGADAWDPLHLKSSLGNASIGERVVSEPFSDASKAEIGFATVSAPDTYGQGLRAGDS
eukprot:653458-Amphidinium_carterae.1